MSQSARGPRRDFYEVLGVPRDVDAVQLKRAYRALALKYHPDQNPDHPQAEALFKEVSEAYTVLSDAEQRARYDRRGWEGLGETGFGLDLGAFTELFDSLFGDLLGKKKGKAAGRDLRYTLELGFAEAALGTTKSIQFPAAVECEACGGLGGKDGSAGMAPCAACGGRGETKVQQGFFTLGKSCPTCRGTGQTVATPCPLCTGTGLVTKQKQYSLTIPANTEDGSTRRVAGQGEPGRHGGPTGDLHVIVRVKPHSFFRFEAGVVMTDVPVSAPQAALGAVIDVPTLDGRVEMRIPAGTQSGTVFRLRGRGVGEPGRRGDAHVRLVVETPSDLTSTQRALYEQLQSSLTEQQAPLQRDFATKVKQTLV